MSSGFERRFFKEPKRMYAKQASERPMWQRNLDRMAKAGRELHEYADAVVTELEGTPILDEDSAAGDNARSALDNARAWRARIEQGV